MAMFPANDLPSPPLPPFESEFQTEFVMRPKAPRSSSVLPLLRRAELKATWRNVKRMVK